MRQARLNWSRAACAAACAALAVACALGTPTGQPAGQPPAQEAGQQQAPLKKDVPYVPTPQSVVDEMLRLAGVKAGDVVYDLGCGDGRLVITAVKKFGAKRGVGVDIDPQRIKESNENAKAAGVEHSTEFRVQDLFQTDFKEASVVTLYLLPDVNLRLRPKLLSDLKPGTRIVSHAFHMGDWEPEKTVTVEPGGQTLYFWTVPAKAAAPSGGAKP